MANDRRFVIKVLGDTTDAMKSFRALDEGAGNMGAKFSELGKTAVRAFGAISVGAMGTAAVSAASDLEESINAVQVTFGEAAEGVLALGENSARTVGLSAQQFNSFAVQFAGFTQQLATGGRSAGQVTDELTRRIADFASVMNLDVAEAAQVFQSSLSGETEPIRRFGIDLSAAAVQAYALSNGLVENASQMTESIKVQARYGLLMEETAKTAGDFENTSDSLANRQRVLRADMGNLAATVGEALVPVLENVLAVVKPLLDAFTSLPKPIQQVITIGGAATIGFRALSKQLQAMNISSKRANKALAGLGLGLAAVTFALNEYTSAKSQVEGAKGRVKSAFDLETGAITDQTEAIIANEFRTGELGEAMEMLGLDVDLATQAVMGNADAAYEFMDSIDGAEKSLGSITDNMGSWFSGTMHVVDALDIVNRQWSGMAQGFDEHINDLRRTTEAEEDLAKAKKQGINANLAAELTLKSYSDAIDATAMDVFFFTDGLDRLAAAHLQQIEKNKQSIGTFIAVGEALGHPIAQTRELITQMGLLDGLSVEVQIELGLFTEAEAALQMLDIQIRALRTSMAALGQTQFMQQRLAPLFGLRNELVALIADEASTPFTGGGGGGMAPVDSAEQDFQNYVDQVVDFGNSLLTDRFAESLFEGTPESIRDTFREIMDEVARFTEGQVDQSLRAFIGNLQGKFAQLSELAKLREELQDQLDGINKAVEASSKLFTSDLDLSDDAELSLTDQMRKRVEAARKFATDLQWLVTSGFPPAILNEVLAAGIAGGSKMVDIIKAMSMDDRSDFISAFAELDRLAEATRETVFVGLGGSEVSQALNNTNDSMSDLVDAIRIDLQSAFSTFLRGLGNQIDRLDGMGMSVSQYGETPVAVNRSATSKGNVTNVSVTVNAGIGTDPVTVGREIVNVLNSYSAAGGAPLSASLVGS